MKRIQLPSAIATFCLLLSLLLPAPTARAADPTPPANMSYQGYLTDADGKSLGVPAQNYTVKFRIFNGTTATAALKWSEQQTVTVDNGHFSVLLGNGTAVTGDDPASTSLSEVFAGTDASDRYIGMTVTGGPGATDSEILPRLQLLASPYAFLAQNAVSVSGQNTILPSNLSPTIGLWSVSGADVYRPNGNVGIGTATPPHKFVVRTGPNQNFQVRPNAYGTNSAVLIQAANDANDTGVPMELGASTFLFHGGNVGIAITNPTARLDVAGLIKSRAGQVYFSDTDGSDRAIVGLESASSTDPVVGFWNGGWHFIVKRSGKVGIGTLTPEAPLHVAGAALITPASYTYLANITTPVAKFTPGPTQTFPFSIVAESKILAEEFDARSDRRIKSIIGTSDSKRDLEMIQKLKVTDYKMVDHVANGLKNHKGFIAQEVRSIIPDAVTAGRDFIPNIFSDASSFQFDVGKKSLSITLNKAHDLKVGDLVRLMTDESILEVKVSEVSATNHFLVGPIQKPSKTLFVYGKQVDDFLSVTYDRIFTTGISAMQELARQVETLKQGQNRIAELEAKGTRVATLERKVEELEKLVVRLANLQKDGKPVSQVTAPGEANVAFLADNK